MRTVNPAIKARPVKVPINLYNKIKKIAQSKGTLIILIMAEALEEYLKNVSKRKTIH